MPNSLFVHTPPSDHRFELIIVPVLNLSKLSQTPCTFILITQIVNEMVAGFGAKAE